MKVYFNGPIVTMEDDHPQAEMLIEDGGKILFVGDAAEGEALIAPDAERVDLAGRTLMPAFIDGHGHFSHTGFFLKTVFLQSAESYDDIVRLMRDYLDAHQGETFKWLVGMGYDHNFLKEDAHPTKEVLDRVSTEIPVVALHASMHMCVANSKMLALAGINRDTPDIPGGVIARDPATGEPTGLLEEMAMHLVLAQLGDFFATTPEDLVKAQSLYIENGVLTVQDGASNPETNALVRGIADAHKLVCDVVSYPCLSVGDDLTPAALKKGFEDCLGTYQNHFKIGGYKIVLDGSPQCKTAWLSEPYTDGENGYPWLTDAQVQECVDIALDDGMQLLTHCNGDASGDQLLDAYEKSIARFGPDAPQHKLRPVMIHCQTARDDQLDRMAKLGMLASIFVAHVNYWGDVHKKNLGETRGAHISPVKAALDRGIVVNFHTDTPVVTPDMLHTVWTAVNRQTRGGEILGADQCVSVWDALKAITIGAAYSYFEEDSKGSLAPGKLADLVILDKNPLAVDKQAIKDIQVLASIKEGQTLYEKAV
ncbi:MAG: amidohydrolase [Peptococcaceae bacterium]|nr:amidohydrolase [Peptococcaceae bacterium]